MAVLTVRRPQNNQLGDDGVEQLMDALRTSSSLQFLDLSVRPGAVCV